MDSNFYAFGSRENTPGLNGDVIMRKDWPATDNLWLFVHRQSMLVKHTIDMILLTLVIPGKVLCERLASWGDATIHQEAGALVGFGPINALDFFLGDVAFSQEIATPKIERRKKRP
jgi:hypothetical protein